MISPEFQNFIITSHINDPGLEVKEEMLYQLICGIRKFFNDPFIILSDSYYVPKRIIDIADITITNRINKNFTYHGNPEMDLIRHGITILKKYQTKYHYRLTYDFILNEDNVSAYLEWPSKIQGNKKLVFAKDTGASSDGLRTNVWFADNDLIESLLPASTSHLESHLYSNIVNSNNLDKLFLYNSYDDMFHNNSNTYDLIGHGGKTLREEKINYFKKFYNYSK